MVESTCCSAVELEGIAALIDGVLSRENIAVDAVLSSLMTCDSDTHEHCVTAQDLAKYPNFSHLSPERLLEAPCQTVKRNLAFYPALREPRRTLIFRSVSESDKSKILTLLQKCPSLNELASGTRPKNSQDAAEAGVVEQPTTPLLSIKSLQTDDLADGSPMSTADGGDSGQEATEVAAEAQETAEDRLSQSILGVKFETSAFAPACYITLATEDLAKEVALWLVAQELEPGRPVRVGIKSEAEWAFATPPPPMFLQRRKPMNYNRNKRKFGSRRPPNRDQPVQHPTQHVAAAAPAASTNVLSALDQFPPLDATLSDQMTIRYSPKELRVIRDTVLRNKATSELHVG